MIPKKKEGFMAGRLPALVLIFFVIAGTWFLASQFNSSSTKANVTETKSSISKETRNLSTDWIAPDESEIPVGVEGDQIRYGKALVAHTSFYLGPKGSVASISNGMNCQNCHNNGGKNPYALNYSAVASTYPKFRARSAKIMSVTERINGCFNRSLNGQSLDTTGKEMLAMIAYINWVGKDVPKGIQPSNSGVTKLAYLDRAADPSKGKVVYATCERCHGTDGQGYMNDNGKEYIFPPLWGPHSYNDGAGLYRLSNFAGFVKSNMPFGTTYKHPELSDEDAWDVAAFVNSQPRPHKDQSKDYPQVHNKPIDSPVGPYRDSFTEKQHKYGPYKPILLANAESGKSK